MLPPEKWWNFTLIGVIFFVFLHSVVFFWHQFLIYRYDAIYDKAIAEGSLIEMPADFREAHSLSRERNIVTRPDILIREAIQLQSSIRSVVDQYRANIYSLFEEINSDIDMFQRIAKEGEWYIFPERADIILQAEILDAKVNSGHYTLLADLQTLAAESHGKVQQAKNLLESVQKKVILQDIEALSHELTFLDSVYRFTGKKWLDYKVFSKEFQTIFKKDVLDSQTYAELKELFDSFSQRLDPYRVETKKIRAQARDKRSKIVEQEKKKWGDILPPEAPIWDVYAQIFISLKQQKMYAYEDGELVLSTPITSGRSGYATIRWTFKIYLKKRGHLMKSPFPDEEYELWVDYWMPFHGAYGIHDACNSTDCWRTSFGGGSYIYNGSHGCVNTPYNAVRWLYGWARVGTTVHVQ